MAKELNHSKKGLINVKNKDNKCVLGCHVRHLNLVENHSTRVSKENKKIADTLDYDGIDFPVCERDYSVIEGTNGININVFSYEGKVYPIYISDKSYSDSMDLLLIHFENKSHYVYIKDFDRLMFGTSKNNDKKWFRSRCLQCFSSECILNRHKEDCLLINGR